MAEICHIAAHLDLARVAVLFCLYVPLLPIAMTLTIICLLLLCAVIAFAAGNAHGSRKHNVEVEQQEYVATLAAVRRWKCVCGEKKLPGRPFCKACFDALPETVKRAMSRMLKRSFVRAYMDAIKTS